MLPPPPPHPQSAGMGLLPQDKELPFFTSKTSVSNTRSQ